MTATTEGNAKVIYKNGWCLILPKNGKEASLFLEWLATFNAGKNVLHKVNDYGDELFLIRLNGTKEQYQAFANYINDNC